MTADQNHGVFHHEAYEAYEDLARAAVELLADENPLLDARGRSRWVALDEQAYYRALEPRDIAPERSLVLTALQRLGIDAPELPDMVPHSPWRALLRQIERTNRLKALGGPDFVINDGLSQLGRLLSTLAGPREPYTPHPCNWRSEDDLVFHTMNLVFVNGDSIGIGDAVNRLPEAKAFRASYPDAYSFWEIHRQPADLEDANRSDPERYPGAIWTAKGVTLPCQFAPGYEPPPEAGPVTYGTPTELVEWITGEYSETVADFVRACRSAAERGRAVLSLIEVHT